VLLDKKEYEKALKIYQQVLEKGKQVLGEDHPVTLMTTRNVALVLESREKYEEALSTYQKALKKRKQILGDNHHDTLMTETNMSGILFDKGEYEKNEIYQKVLREFEQMFGFNHPNTKEMRDLVHKTRQYCDNFNVSHVHDNKPPLHKAAASESLKNYSE
jgi:tetratricopeptide (TPR) repeat protein